MRELCKYIPVGPIIVGVLVFSLIPFDSADAASQWQLLTNVIMVLH